MCHAEEDFEAPVTEAFTAASFDSVSGPTEKQLTAADLPDHIGQYVDPDNTFAAGQAVPNLRSLHRQLPSGAWAPGASSAHATSSSDQDTCIIPMVQLGSAGVRQVSTLLNVLSLDV